MSGPGLEELTSSAFRHCATSRAPELVRGGCLHLCSGATRPPLAGSGTIDLQELKQVLHSLGHYPSAFELQELMDAMDTNRSGSIDFDEFVRCMADEEEIKELEAELKDLENVFMLFDKDGSGSIDAEEVGCSVWVGVCCLHVLWAKW